MQVSFILNIHQYIRLKWVLLTWSSRYEVVTVLLFAFDNLARHFSNVTGESKRPNKRKKLHIWILTGLDKIDKDDCTTVYTKS